MTTPTYTARRICKDTLIVNGSCVHIDRTAYGRTWCTEKGMTATARVTADGETYTLYTGMIRTVIGGTVDAACLIPA